MGKTRFELWQEGRIGDLRGLVELKPNDVWGPSPSMIPLRDLGPGISGTRNLAMGLRKDNFHILSDEEIDSLKQDIAAIQADINVFRFNKGYVTGYNDANDEIQVCGDVLPDKNSKIARDLMSSRAVLAHEYYGHRANRGTKLPKGSWNDEFRASYMAAKNAPGLSKEDRAYLLQDAMDRAAEASIFIRPNKLMMRILREAYYE